MRYQDIRTYSKRTCSLHLGSKGRHAIKLATRDDLFIGRDVSFYGEVVTVKVRKFPAMSAAIVCFMGCRHMDILQGLACVQARQVEKKC
jgi:hypothetical protein